MLYVELLILHGRGLSNATAMVLFVIAKGRDLNVVQFLQWLLDIIPPYRKFECIQTSKDTIQSARPGAPGQAKPSSFASMPSHTIHYSIIIIRRL